MDLKEIRRRGKTAFRSNMLITIGAALVAALLVKGSLSISGNSYSALAYLNTGDAAVSTESTETASAELTEGTEVTSDAVLASDSESTVEESTESTASSTETTSYTNTDIYIAIAADQGTRLLGALLPSSLGMFLNLMLRTNGMIAMLVTLLISNVLEVGLCRLFMINTMRKAYMNELTWGFKNKRYWRMMMIQLYRMCWICIFGMLLIVPGIWKALEMRAVPYLLNENPNMKMEEAFQKSKEIMMGHKKEAFLLDLSFFWWDALSILTLGITGALWSNPYKMAAQAEFYAAIRGGEMKIDGMTGGTRQVVGKPDAFSGYHSYQKKNK